MYQIKQTPQDFLVDEIINTSRIIPEPAKRFLYFILKKTDKTTLYAVGQIARTLDIEEKLIGFGGLKDRHATTTQYISIPNFGGKTSPQRIESLTLEGISLTFVGSCDVPLYVGALTANKFTITVTGLTGFEISGQKNMVNYFGEQRFSDNNATIGKLLVKKRFKEALDLIFQGSGHEKDVADARKYCAQHPNDSVGALRRLQPNLVMLYVHAFQSQLWNEVASAVLQCMQSPSADAQKSGSNNPLASDYFDEKLGVRIPKRAPASDLQIPLLGFDYEAQEHDPLVAAKIKEILAREQINVRDFISKEFAQLTKSGDKRAFIVTIQELSSELQPSSDSAKFTFTLQKGSYATVALRHLLIPRTKTE